MESLQELPFFGLKNYEIKNMFIDPKQQWDDVMFDNTLREHLRKLYSDELFRSLDCTYVTPDHFNHTYNALSKSIELSVFHVNIQCLNAKHRALCQLLESCCVEFDVIVLTEIWSCNIDFYRNILPGYNFHYELPQEGRVGGVGMYVKSSHCHNIISAYNLPNPNGYKVEDIWIEVIKNNKKFLIGGIYRHPNQNILDFSTMLEATFSKISHQKLPCIIAGDFNIDLLQWDTQKGIHDYLDTVTTQNFTPLIILPTRITSKSSTLIDHIYFYAGKTNKNKKN